MLIAQVVVNGILLGGLYACIAVGFSLIWGVMNLINLAHGSLLMFGAFGTYQLHRATGIDPLLTIPAVAGGLFAFGYLVQRQLINRVLDRSMFMTLILTFGLNMVLVNLALALFSADIRSITLPYSGAVLELAGLRVPYVRIVVFAVAALLTTLLFLFTQRTRIGTAIQATSFDRDAARLVGIDVAQMYAITFGIGAAIAGVAGSLVAMVQSFSPVLGDSYTMKAFVVVVLGGLGSIPGAFAAGILLGVTENLASVLLDPGYRDAISFAVLVLVLAVSTKGMFGKRFYAEI